MGSGDSVDAYRVDGCRMLLVPRHSDASETNRLQAEWLPRLAAVLDVAIPNIDRVVEIDDSWAIGYPELLGTPLTHMSEPLEADVGRFLSQLGAADAPSLRRREGPQAHELEEASTVLSPALRRFCGGLLSAYEAPPSVLIHGDLRPQHLLVKEGRLSGVLDFGDAAIGDPAWELLPLRHEYGDACARRLDSDPRSHARAHTLSAWETLRWCINCVRYNHQDQLGHALQQLEAHVPA